MRLLRRLHESSAAKASEVKWRSCELVSGGVVAGEVVPSVLSVPPVPLSFKSQALSFAMRSQAIRENSCAAKAAFVTGGAMEPEGVAMSWTRRPAKPGRGADTAAPSRHRATHRLAGFVVARSASEHILPSSLLVTTPQG